MTAAAAGAGAGSSQQAGIKLSTPEVFDRIREITCRVLSPHGESTGCLLGDGTVVTVQHNVSTEDLFFTTIVRGGVDYTPRSSDGLNEQNAKTLDLYSLKTDISGYKPVEKFTGELKEGTTVYFSGYPLGQESMTFHKGIISSITLLAEGVRSFTIDGTVVPGCSGGPVVVQEGGKVQLIGIITSEIADLAERDMQTVRIMSHFLDTQNTEGADVDSAMSAVHSGEILHYYHDPETSGGEGIDMDYMDRLVPITNREIIARTMGLLSRNFGTGIGSALDIRSMDSLFRETDLEIPEGHSFPVKKGNGVCKGTVGSVKYVEKRYGGSGPGPRGICLNGPNYNSVVYKFTDNPHKAPGNYNKNQEQLYRNAAAYLEQNHPGGPPASFTFDACGHRYTADKQA